MLVAKLLCLFFVGSALRAADTVANGGSSPSPCLSAAWSGRDPGDIPEVKNSELVEVKLQQLSTKPDMQLQIRLEKLRWGIVSSSNSGYPKVAEIWDQVWEGPVKNLPSDRNELLIEATGQRSLAGGVYRLIIIISDVNNNGISGCATQKTLVFVVRDQGD